MTGETMAESTDGNPHLSKSKYLAGRQCAKRVWLQCHERSAGAPPDGPLRAIFDTGNEVGRRAHALFPGGVLVDETRWETGVVERTRALVAEAVPAIFEDASLQNNDS